MTLREFHVWFRNRRAERDRAASDAFRQEVASA
jgi:hypothetical protein